MHSHSSLTGIVLLAVVQDHVFQEPRFRVQEGVDNVRMELLSNNQNVMELVEQLLVEFFLDGQNVLESEALQLGLRRRRSSQRENSQKAEKKGQCSPIHFCPNTELCVATCIC